MEKAFLLTLMVVSLVIATPTYDKECARDSYIPLLATGGIKLNPMDIDTGSANKNYYQDLSEANFNTIDVLGYGFALSGFKTDCGGDYYTLVVDKVLFENQNTRMRIVVDFRNPDNDEITKWTLVWFNYIVVSRNLNGAYSDIWATVAEVTPSANSVSQSIDSTGTTYMSVPAGTCSVYDDPHYSFDPASCFETDAAEDDSIGGSIVIHAYIMGFRWDRNGGSGTADTHLGAAVLNGGSSLGSLDPDTDETSWVVSAVRPSGPVVYINTFGQRIKYLKVAFVLSRLDSFFIGNTGGSIFSREYVEYDTPTDTRSELLYSSSYIYEQVETFNQTVTLHQGAIPSEFNRNYFKLPDKRYSMYGLSSFQLPISTTYSCTSLEVQVTLDSFDTYTVYTPNIARNHFLISGEIFTKNIWDLCAPSDPADPRFENKITFGKKSQTVIPSQTFEQFIQEDLTLLKLPANQEYSGILGEQDDAVYLHYYAKATGATDTIIYKAQIPYIGMTAGAPIKVEFGFFDGPHPLSESTYQPNKRMINGKVYTITLEVNGYVMYNIKYTGGTSVYLDLATNEHNLVNGIFRGTNLQSTVANVVITISFERDATLDQSMYTYILLSEYTQAYDPSTGCCTTRCPAQTGLDVSLILPVCVSCDSQMGLWYNPNNGTCTCLPGYYLDPSKTFQCYPCQSPYCDMCDPEEPTKCYRCATGAQLNLVTHKCSCSTGFFINGTKCQQCNYRCANCTPPNGQCDTCVDPQHRDIAQDCKCISGYYDSGSVNCTKCMSSCLTCSNGTSCDSCNTTNFREPKGGICVCMDGYYEFYNNDQSRECKKCSPECLTCSIAPTSCTSCDPDKNRVPGIDLNGHQTCECQPGYYSTDDGSCIQSDCNADPFCSQCEQGLQLCVKCLASKNRVIKMPEAICVCEQGYYEDSNDECVPCGHGCSICNSATKCVSCVALATPAQDGKCDCPAETFFTISPEGVRYCASCPQYCEKCSNATSCEVCLNGTTKTADNQCVCGKGRYLTDEFKCVPCLSGCQVCTSATNCSKCTPPLRLQANECKDECDQGYIVSGGMCKPCPEGCLQCGPNDICYYCADQKYSYNGLCYDICPPGTVGSQQTSNWACLPCNSPCRTCMNHPSFCTSCQAGKGYLQTSDTLQSCVAECTAGTFAKAGVCQLCDFKCATCIGSKDHCLSCPGGQLLYKSSCWGACPAIYFSGSSGLSPKCIQHCPSGFFKVSNSECASCSPQCKTCEGSPDNCTECLHGSVTLGGQCSSECGPNEFAFHGVCIACSESCKGCSGTPQSCVNCATGYVRTGSICEKGCQTVQYFNKEKNLCQRCNSRCKTCTAYNFCTSCHRANIVPRGGVCSECPYPCRTCDAHGKCSSCLSGFYFFLGKCTRTCPGGSIPGDGVCRCLSGLMANGYCVTNCPPGHTSIDGQCLPCNPNCAQCSGTVNTCTHCISGFSLNNSTRLCVPNNKCPYGQDINIHGVCQNICPVSYYFFEGVCMFNECKGGYFFNQHGGCVRSGGNLPALHCPYGQYHHNGACVTDCGLGYCSVPEQRKCAACPEYCQVCSEPSYCYKCKDGYTAYQGICYSYLSCASGQLRYNDGCVSECPLGTSQQDGQCERNCPDNTYEMNFYCYVSCPSSLRTADACVSTCPFGTQAVNGVCQ